MKQLPRDKVRDEYFESLGYTVLRIPAKVVFSTPQEAVERVRSALRVGKRLRPVHVPTSGWGRLSNTLSSIPSGIVKLNELISKNEAVALALKDATPALNAEKTIIGVAIARVQSNLGIGDFLAKVENSDTRQAFKDGNASLMEAVAERRSARQERAKHSNERIIFPAAPLPSGNIQHDIAIQAGYARMAEDRASFLESQKRILESDSRLPLLVQQELGKMGHADYWALL
jgi:hypothetical protein